MERAALYALAAIVIAGLAWSVLGSIPTWVQGKGILVSQGVHLFNATAPATGTVISVLPSGSIVHKGDLIAQLDAGSLRQDLDNAHQVVAEKRIARDKVAERYDRQIALTTQNITQRKTNLGRISATAQQSVAFYQKLLAQEEGYQKHGAVTPLTVQETRQKMTQADADGRAARGEMLRLEAEQQDLANRRDADLRQADEAVNQAQRHAGEIAAQLERATRVLSPLAGVVTEVDVTPGSVIATGKPIASIEAAGEGLELLLYIPPEQGKKVRPGMAVNIEPATVRKEEFGTLTGRVLSVSDYPMTAEGMQSILQNAQLVSSFMALSRWRKLPESRSRNSPSTFTGSR